jgi:hypothetical protein
MALAGQIIFKYFSNINAKLKIMQKNDIMLHFGISVRISRKGEKSLVGL